MKTEADDKFRNFTKKEIVELNLLSEVHKDKIIAVIKVKGGHFECRQLAKLALETGITIYFSTSKLASELVKPSPNRLFSPGWVFKQIFLISQEDINLLSILSDNIEVYKFEDFLNELTKPN